MKKILLICFAFLTMLQIYGQETRKITQELSSLESKVWTKRSIPVCWENATTSNETEREWVRDAVRNSWEAQSRVRFTGWEDCTSASKGIRIIIEDRSSQGPHTKGLGIELDGKKNGMGLNFTFNNWDTNFGCTGTNLQFCIEAIAVHEFGHALSFAHEHNRGDKSDDCTRSPQGTNGDWNITKYDAESIMNYCSTNWTNNGNLSESDIAGVRWLYGPPQSEIKNFGSAFAVGDFNNDGKDDLAIGASLTENSRGRVFLYKGTSGKKLVYWHTIDQTFLGANEDFDTFGSSLAAGDFNKDGYDDLAIGIPGEKPGNDPKSGYVMVFKGAKNKLKPWKGFGQDKLGKNEHGDQFGFALASGDFNGDRYDDLAVGIPGESPGSSPKSGDVMIFKGTRSGLIAWKGFGGQKGLGTNEHGDQFGFALTSGDFNGDGKDDLAVGSPGETPGKTAKSGDVFIYKGTSSGLTPWRGFGGQKGLGKNEHGDQMGFALASGDFNGDGKDDLVVSAPGEAPGKDPKSGDIFIYKGTSLGPIAWKGFGGQKGLDTNKIYDKMGIGLTVGDFNADGKDDIAVGIPGKNNNAGNVLIYKGGTAVTPWKNFKGQRGLGKDETYDFFGQALITGDFNGDRRADLAVGIPGERPGRSRFKTGVVFIYQGTSGSTVLNPVQGINP